MRDQSSHQVKRQLIRQFVVVGEGLEDFEAEIALNKRSSHLEVSNVDEIQHQGKDLIVDLSTYTQLAVQTLRNYNETVVELQQQVKEVIFHDFLCIVAEHASQQAASQCFAIIKFLHFFHQPYLQERPSGKIPVVVILANEVFLKFNGQKTLQDVSQEVDFFVVDIETRIFFRVGETRGHVFYDCPYEVIGLTLVQKHLPCQFNEAHVFFAAVGFTLLEEVKEGVEEGYFFGQIRSFVHCRVYGGKQHVIIELDTFEDGIQSGERMRGHQRSHFTDDLIGTWRESIEQFDLFLRYLMIMNGEMQIAESLLAYHMQIDVELYLEPKAVHQSIQFKGYSWIIVIILNSWQDVPFYQVSSEPSDFLAYLLRFHRNSYVFAVADAPQDSTKLGEGGFLGEDVGLADVQQIGD